MFTEQYLEGSIASIEDEENYGRVRVHITGKTEGMDTDDLPYARVLYPLSEVSEVSDSTAEVGTLILMIQMNKNDYNSLVILGRFKRESQNQ